MTSPKNRVDTSTTVHHSLRENTPWNFDASFESSFSSETTDLGLGLAVSYVIKDIANLTDLTLGLSYRYANTDASEDVSLNEVEILQRHQAGAQSAHVDVTSRHHFNFNLATRLNLDPNFALELGVAAGLGYDVQAAVVNHNILGELNYAADDKFYGVAEVSAKGIFVPNTVVSPFVKVGYLNLFTDNSSNSAALIAAGIQL